MINRDPSRFKQLPNGEWWLFKNDKPWGRAVVRNCANCKEDYLDWPGKHTGKFCTRACAHTGLLPVRRIHTGPHSPRWNGGRIMVRGYVHVFSPDHPACQGNRRSYVAEHRLVMEAYLGRFLTSAENVHHKNGIKTDNRLENLELWSVTQPAGQRVEEQRCCTCCTGKCRE